MEIQPPTREAVLRELALVLSSPTFTRNERQSRFLRFVVDRQLDGRSSELKESVIAVEVFGRPADYDSKTDTIVRTEAVRLRARLGNYYTGDGQQDPLIIELPKGGYRPLFRQREPEKTTHQVRPKTRGLAFWSAAGMALVAVGIASVLILQRQEASEAGPVRFAVDVPPGVTLGHNLEQRGLGTAAPHFAPSPDGRQLAYVAFSFNNKPQLWVRRLNDVAGHPLAGTQDATFPFWSPDSRVVAFFAEGKLKKIDASGGSPQIISDASAGEGGTWNRDGDIVFAPHETSGLFRVSSSGGRPVPLTMLNDEEGEVSHRWPQFLPDGRHFLYLAMRGPIASMSVGADGTQDVRAIYAGSLDSPARALVIRGALRSAYSAGHLLFIRRQTLMAQAFDAGSLRLSGEEIPIADHISVNAGNGRTGFAVSESGLLMYRREVVNGVRQLVWLDRNGNAIAKFGEPGNYGAFRLSPDSRRLAAYLRDRADPGQLRIFEIADTAPASSSVFARMQSEAAFAWSSDGSRIAYTLGDGTELYQKTTTGVGNADLIVKSAETKEVGTWSPDDRYLAYTQIGQKTRRDIWIISMLGDRKRAAFLATDFNEYEPIFSPDGRWIVYMSDKDGGGEGLYVRPFPAGDREWKLAGEDSARPQWRADSKELFYISRGNLMSIAIDPNRIPAFGAPVKLFDAPISPGRFGEYAVSADGQRFLMIEQQDAASTVAAVPLTVVTNWREGFGR